MAGKIKCTETSYLGGRIFTVGSYYDEEEIPHVHRKEKCLGFDWPEEPKKKAGRPPKEDADAKKAAKEAAKEESVETPSEPEKDND